MGIPQDIPQTLFGSRHKRDRIGGDQGGLRQTKLRDGSLALPSELHRFPYHVVCAVFVRAAGAAYCCRRRFFECHARAMGVSTLWRIFHAPHFWGRRII